MTLDTDLMERLSKQRRFTEADIQSDIKCSYFQHQTLFHPVNQTTNLSVGRTARRW